MLNIDIVDHDFFGTLPRNGPKFDKIPSKLTQFSVFVAYRYVGITMQKDKYARYFNLGQ